jgi:hypothetical protein
VSQNGYYIPCVWNGCEGLTGNLDGYTTLDIQQAAYQIIMLHHHRGKRSVYSLLFVSTGTTPSLDSTHDSSIILGSFAALSAITKSVSSCTTWFGNLVSCNKDNNELVPIHNQCFCCLPLLKPPTRETPAPHGRESGVQFCLEVWKLHR